MRTNRVLAIAFLTAPALLASAGLAQNAKPATSPAAPAAAQPAAAAPGPSDPAAKAILSEASAAVKKITGLTFNAKRSLEGNVPIKLSASGQVWFLRNAGSPSSSAFYAKGVMSQPMAKGDTTLEAYFDGARGVWVDDAKKEVVEKAMGGPEQTPKVKQAKQQLFPSQFFDTEPFVSEMNAQQIVLGEPAKVDGQDCDVVRLVNSGQRETHIFVAKSDHLPRKIEQVSPAGQGVATFTLELSGVKPAEVKPADFKIALPEGFTKRVEEAKVTPPPPPPPPPGTDPKTTQPSFPKGGPEVGSAAPAWVLKRADGGSNATLAEQKGKVVVLGFWGSLFGDSRGMLATLEQTKQAVAGKNVSIFGVACREQAGAPGADAAKKAFTDAKCSFPLLLEGDASASDYKLRGFPSVAVVDGEGKVAAFFESAPTADELRAAIEKAASGTAPAAKTEGK